MCSSGSECGCLYVLSCFGGVGDAGDVLEASDDGEYDDVDC